MKLQHGIRPFPVYYEPDQDQDEGQAEPGRGPTLRGPRLILLCVAPQKTTIRGDAAQDTVSEGLVRPGAGRTAYDHLVRPSIRTCPAIILVGPTDVWGAN